MRNRPIRLRLRSARFRSQAVLSLALALLAGACSDSTTTATGTDGPVVIDNLGGAPLEGHTPRGFAGSGTGLFAGDNLNANFPEGEGVQIFIAFDIADIADLAGQIDRATLSSDALSVRGAPFETLGTLRAQAVSFESFGPPVFETPGLGDAAECVRRDDSAIDCDVTDAATAALADGRSHLQMRVRFDTPGDGDGERDLALFFLTDSNTNEPGIFTLTLE